MSARMQTIELPAGAVFGGNFGEVDHAADDASAPLVPVKIDQISPSSFCDHSGLAPARLRGQALSVATDVADVVDRVRQLLWDEVGHPSGSLQEVRPPDWVGRGGSVKRLSASHLVLRLGAKLGAKLGLRGEEQRRVVRLAAVILRLRLRPREYTSACRA